MAAIGAHRTAKLPRAWPALASALLLLGGCTSLAAREPLQVMGMKDGAPADQIRHSMSGKIGSHRFSASGDFSMKPAAPAEAADSV